MSAVANGGVVHVVAGPDGHGVTRHALGLLGRAPLAHHRVLRLAGLPDSSTQEVVERLASAPGSSLLHLHLTDHLYAASATQCAEIVTRLAQRRRIGLTLHDLPAPGDGPGRYERRRAAYGAMAAAAAVVVVASGHEARLLRTCLTEEGVEPGGDIHVVPLPLGTPVPPPEREKLLSVALANGGGGADGQVRAALPAQALPSGHLSEPGSARDLVVFGFVYPGKGHVPAIEALSGPPPLPPDVGVMAMGAVSPGHDHLVDELTSRAARLGRRFTVTGHVPDEEVVAWLRSAAVPVAPHEHVSASGSIGSWLSAGRRPVVPAGDYADELESRCPGALLRYGPDTPFASLAEAARAALDDPALTWLAPDVRLHPTPDEAAAAYARILDTIAQVR